MVRKIYITLILISFNLLYVSAQNFTFSGDVIDVNNEALPYATVRLSSVENSTNTGTVTNEQGQFSVENLSAGKYRIEVSFVGYSTFSDTIDVKQSMKLNTIQLKNGVDLDEVVVTGHRKLVKVDKGKLTLTVKDSYLAKLPAAKDVLAFAPGVIIKGETIEVIGKGTPLIFINGREVKNPSQISSLQPERIKSISVDRNPSSKYDARYRSVVHITTSESTKQELSAQIIHSSAMGKLYNHSEKLNINHIVGKWTNFLSYKYKNTRNKEGVSAYQNLRTATMSQKNNFNSEEISKGTIHSLVLGSNLRVNDKHSVDMQYFLDKETYNYKITGHEELLGKENNIYDVARNGTDVNTKHTVNFNYRWITDSVSQFNLFADYSYLKNIENDNVNNTSKIKDTVDNYVLGNHSKFNTYALRGEYATQFWKNYDFNVGLRFSEIRNNTSSEIGKITQQEEIMNKTELKERTWAIYGTLGREFGNFSTEIGLRVERNEGEYLKNGTSVFGKKRVVNNFFPSLALSYAISESTQLNLNYTSKISRPSFEDLDPSIEYLNTIFYQQGNPELKPTINQTIELSGTFGDNLNVSVGYTHTKDAIAYLVEPEGTNSNLLINRAVNIDKSSSLDFNASYSFAVGKWRSNLIGNISVPFIKYPHQGLEKSNNITQYQFITTNSYMISPKMFLVGNFVAQSRYSYLNNVISPTYNFVLAANFIMLKGKMIVTVFGNDLLNKSEANNYSEWGYVKTGQDLKPDSRMLGVKLKFNLNKFKNKFEKSESSSEDLERIE